MLACRITAGEHPAWCAHRRTLRAFSRTGHGACPPHLPRLVLGIWAVTGGAFEFFAAFRVGEGAGTRAIFIIGGLVAVLFGLVILARPGIGALTLALLFGLFNLIYGFWQIAFGVDMHHAKATKRQAPPINDRASAEPTTRS